MATNSIFTNGMSTSASIYYRIEPVCISLGERYSFPFASAAIAIVRA